MKPWIELARAAVPGGGTMTLHQRDGERVIRVDGQELMSSRRHGSEERLAELGCGRATRRVLVGGLGMGFTLRAVLARAGAGAEVVVAELSADVVAWNRDLLGPEAAACLADPRVRVEVADVAEVMRAGGFDAILLDVDNGPHALSRPANRGLYGPAGLAAARAALRPRGVVAIWSASQHPEFARRLERAGFAVEVHGARAAGSGGLMNTIYVARAR